MKKNVIKKLFIILITIFVLLISFELYCRSIVYKKYKYIIQTQINANKNFNGNLTYEKVICPSYNERKAKFKPVSIGKYKDKPSIVLFGCSFTWGSYLKENETFASVLSQYTGRTVYNRGLYGTGIPFMYFQLNDNNIFYLYAYR